MATGEFHEMFETEGEAISYALHETKDSSGFLVAQIPSPEVQSAEGTNQGTAQKSASGIIPFKMLARALYRIDPVEGSYFSFKCTRQTNKEKILQLAGYMDEAMKEFFRMKLMDQAGMNSMIKLFGKPRVVVTNLVETEFNDYMVKMPSLAPSEPSGMATTGRFKILLKTSINLSRTVIEAASDEELKSIAYLLTYRMIYYMYFGDAMDWFAYASAVWMAEKYSGVSHHDPSLFSISGKSPFWGMEASLNLKLGPPSLNLDYVTAMAFGLKDKQLEYFDRSRDLTITNMKALADNDYSSIIVAVVNSANEPTTNETLTIELDSKLQTTPEDLNYVFIESIKANSTYTDNSGNVSESQVLYRDGTPRKGEMKDYTFTASWTEPYSSGTSSGSIVITFDPEHYPRRITGFSITETRKLSDTRTFTLKGEKMDFPGYKDQSGNITSYNFLASGADVCDYLTYINQDYKNSDLSYTYSTDGKPICIDKSGINMRLYYLEE